jgi:hypothetical protein
VGRKGVKRVLVSPNPSVSRIVMKKIKLSLYQAVEAHTGEASRLPHFL